MTSVGDNRMNQLLLQWFHLKKNKSFRNVVCLCWVLFQNKSLKRNDNIPSCSWEVEWPTSSQQEGASARPYHRWTWCGCIERCNCWMTRALRNNTHLGLRIVSCWLVPFLVVVCRGTVANPHEKHYWGRYYWSHSWLRTWQWVFKSLVDLCL